MSCGDPWRSTRYWPRLRDLDFLGLLSGMGMLGAGVNLELAIHRIAHLGLRQHAANRFLHETNRLALADVDGALLAQATFISAVPPIKLLAFLAPGQLDRPGIDDDHVITRVNERGIHGLVLALQQARRQGCHPAQHLVAGIDDVPPAIRALGARDERTHECCLPERLPAFLKGILNGPAANPAAPDLCRPDLQPQPPMILTVEGSVNPAAVVSWTPKTS